MRRIHLLAPIAVLALAGCNSGADTTAATADNTVVTDNMAMDQNVAAVNGAETMAAPLPATPQEFVNTAAASDNYEIESSKLAADKAQSADVKTFAKMLVEDHTKSTAALKAATAKMSPPLTPDPTLTPELQSNLDALKGASGADFDSMYLAQQIPAHEKAHAMLQTYSVSGDVPELKEWASMTAPVVQQHLEKARSMQTTP